MPPGPDGPDRAEVTSSLRAAGAAFALVFGSWGPGGEPRPDSDLDVAAWWPHDPPPPWELSVPAGTDLLILNDAGLELAGRISLQHELLFEDSPADRVRWVATTRRIWLDERPRWERAHREFLEASAHGR